MRNLLVCLTNTFQTGCTPKMKPAVKEGGGGPPPSSYRQPHDEPPKFTFTPARTVSGSEG
jgi:hypothetical protein